MLIFSLEVHECFSFRNIKKIAEIYFGFWLKSFQKTEWYLNQHMNNKSSDKKEFYLTINLVYPREESLQFFFLKLSFLNFL
jgi:hypothetical protein